MYRGSTALYLRFTSRSDPIWPNARILQTLLQLAAAGMPHWFTIKRRAGEKSIFKTLHREIGVVASARIYRFFNTYRRHTFSFSFLFLLSSFLFLPLPFPVLFFSPIVEGKTSIRFSITGTRRHYFCSIDGQTCVTNRTLMLLNR